MSQQSTSQQSEGWQSSAGYIWSLIGSAVGFANILSFSAHAYKNGGGAFMLPYIMALMLLGIPLLMLEGVIGKRFKVPLVASYGLSSTPHMRFFGWLAILACFTIGAFYIVLTGYSVAYVYLFATNSLPSDTATFFKDTFLKLTPELTTLGSLSLPVFSATAVVIAITWWVMSKQISHGVERICSLFMPLLAIMVLLFALFVTFLPGGYYGWVYFLTPDFSRLGDLKLWSEVFGQLLFSLSLGLGIVVGYSRHAKEDFNIAKAMRCVAVGDFTVSFLAGAAIFGCISHISYIQRVPFEQLMSGNGTFEIGFILFPKILQQFNPIIIPFLGSLFFFCIFIAGITGVFSIVESIAGNVEVEFGLSRQKAVAITMSLLLPCSLLFCFGNGNHLIDALEPLVVGSAMLMSTLAMCVVFLYREKATRDHPIWKEDLYNRLAYHSLRSLIPPMLIVILLGTTALEWNSFDSATMTRSIWLLAATFIATACVRFGKQAANSCSFVRP